MIKDILGKVKRIVNSGTTYNFGILQTKAYKALKGKTSELLKEHSLATTDWAVLGLLYDNTEGLRLIEIADMLGVEAPFVTFLADGLEKKGLIYRVTSETDKRSKCLKLSPSGEKMVKEVEVYLKRETKYLIEGISVMDLLAYRRVMSMVLENEAKEKRG